MTILIGALEALGVVLAPLALLVGLPLLALKPWRRAAEE